MAKPLLSFQDVHVRRGMSVVLDGCSVDVASGQTVVLTGANGAGKSTLLEAAVGLLPLEQGRVLHNTTAVIDAEGRRRTSPLTVGTVLQKNGMLGSEVVIEHLQCAMSMSGSTVNAEPFLEAFNLAHRANDMVAHLSQGQARKVAVLAGLLPAFASSTPALVLLDEPDAGLDEASVNVLCGWLDQLRGHGHAILIATHDQRLMDRATHTVDVAEGTMVAAQSPSEATHNEPQRQPTKPTRRAAWGVKMHLRTMMWLNTNGMAGLLSLGVLLAMGSFMDGLDEMQQLGFVLAPTMAMGLCGEPLVSALREERTAAWWRAVSGGEPHAGWLPFALGLVMTLMSATALQGVPSMQTLVVGSALCGVVWHGVGWMQRSTQRLARPQAVFVGLLTPVLILPYSLLLSVLS
ncbi:MAG: ATP-binding cassette domain-containing protein [Candidatus Thermoplasmatota archaeon]|nr:ATP-binding cassette domain-containing protein [Candidatus Thermoplasmatota archaeon]